MVEELYSPSWPYDDCNRAKERVKERAKEIAKEVGTTVGSRH